MLLIILIQGRVAQPTSMNAGPTLAKTMPRAMMGSMSTRARVHPDGQVKFVVFVWSCNEAVTCF